MCVLNVCILTSNLNKDYTNLCHSSCLYYNAKPNFFMHDSLWHSNEFCWIICFHLCAVHTVGSTIEK